MTVLNYITRTYTNVTLYRNGWENWEILQFLQTTTLNEMLKRLYRVFLRSSMDFTEKPKSLSFFYWLLAVNLHHGRIPINYAEM